MSEPIVVNINTNTTPIDVNTTQELIKVNPTVIYYNPPPGGVKISTDANNNISLGSDDGLYSGLTEWSSTNW